MITNGTGDETFGVMSAILELSEKRYRKMRDHVELYESRARDILLRLVAAGAEQELERHRRKKANELVAARLLELFEYWEVEP